MHLTVAAPSRLRLLALSESKTKKNVCDWHLSIIEVAVYQNHVFCKIAQV